MKYGGGNLVTYESSNIATKKKFGTLNWEKKKVGYLRLKLSISLVEICPFKYAVITCNNYTLKWQGWNENRRFLK